MNNKPIRRFLRYALSASLLFVLMAGAVTVYAAFPGTNGKIAFESYRDGNAEVYVMNADGSGQTNLTNNPADDGVPAWSPDGTKIAFYSNRDGNPEIYVMNANGSGQTRITNNPASDYEPTWSPDGTKIAFYSNRDDVNGEIYVMNADGSGVPTRLTNNTAVDIRPSWSPDGTKIAFDSNRDGDTEIYVMNSDGSGQTNLTNHPANDDSAAWSPDGTKIAFGSYRDNPSQNEIYVMNADGTNQINLFDSNSTDDGSQAWSPDGTKIVFHSSLSGHYDIWVVNADGTSGLTNLTNDSPTDVRPDWQPIPPPFNFSGFFQPVDNLPTLNAVKAGQAIPVKFSLNGDQGLDIFAAGYPKSQYIACDSTAALDGIEVTLTAGSSSLSYDPSTDTYTYVWKTDKAWANTCRQLVVKLNDGTYHQANFKFK